MNTPRETRPQVSIIIPCRNEAVHIEECILSVLAQEQPEGDFEIIVADGMSNDGTREILDDLIRRPWFFNPVVPGQVRSPVVRLIDNPGRIVSTGLNAAIRAAQGQIIIRMDAHTEYAPDYIRKCVAALQESQADNVGGPWTAQGTSYLSHAIAAAFQSAFAVGGARSHQPGHEGSVDSVYLGCWRKEAFERFGYFDEELVRNQDDEHNLRITRGGGRIWQSPKIRSWYRPRGSLVALFKQYMQYGYWKVRVIQKHKLPASWRHLVPGAFVLSLLVLSLGAFVSALLANLRPPTSDLRLLTSGLCSLLLLCQMGVYTVCVLTASIITAARTQWKLFPVLPAVFACYHFGYGWGFVRGIVDFLVLRRGGRDSFGKLTRGERTTGLRGTGPQDYGTTGLQDLELTAPQVQVRGPVVRGPVVQ